MKVSTGKILYKTNIYNIFMFKIMMLAPVLQFLSQGKKIKNHRQGHLGGSVAEASAFTSGRA